MKNHDTKLEVVLEAFATEVETNPNALKKYLSEYPYFSRELVDLSKELKQLAAVAEDTSQDDEAFLNETLLKFQLPRAQGQSIQRIPAASFKSAARTFEIPVLVLQAIKEKRVEPSTISNRLFDLMARAIQIRTEELRSYLSGPLNVAIKANKANGKPAAATKVPFEQILQDANISSEDLAELIERRL